MANIVKLKVEKDLKATVKEALDQLGGLEKYVKSGEKVLLKPNFNTADPPPASTDIEFLRTVVELIIETGAQEIIIADSSTLALKTKEVMEKLGVFELEKDYPSARVVNFDEGKWIKKEIKRGKYLGCVSIPEILEQVDKLFWLPCLKTHRIAGFTGALKLAVGCMRPRQRMALHVGHVQEKVAEMNTVIKPDLIIMDGRKTFIKKGPEVGTVKKPNIILASTNRVAIDIEGIKVIQSYEGNDLAGIDGEELPQIKRARELGIN